MIDLPPPESAMHPYLRALRERVLVYDGAMGTNIQRHNPTAGGFRRQGARGVQRQPRAHAAGHHPVDPRVVSRRGLRRRGDVHLPEHAAPAARSGDSRTRPASSTSRPPGSPGPPATSTRRRTGRASSPDPSGPPACCRRAAIPRSATSPSRRSPRRTTGRRSISSKAAWTSCSSRRRRTSSR